MVSALAKGVKHIAKPDLLRTVAPLIGNFPHTGNGRPALCGISAADIERIPGKTIAHQAKISPGIVVAVNILVVKGAVRIGNDGKECLKGDILGDKLICRLCGGIEHPLLWHPGSKFCFSRCLGVNRDISHRRPLELGQLAATVENRFFSFGIRFCADQHSHPSFNFVAGRTPASFPYNYHIFSGISIGKSLLHRAGNFLRIYFSETLLYDWATEN